MIVFFELSYIFCIPTIQDTILTAIVFFSPFLLSGDPGGAAVQKWQPLHPEAIEDTMG